MRTALLLALLSLPLMAQETRTLDKKFVLLSLAGKSAMTADFVTTKHNLDAGYYENNPLLGERPSAGRLVATGMAFDASLDGLSYWLKKRGNKFWWAPRVAQIAVNSKCAWHNARIR